MHPLFHRYHRLASGVRTPPLGVSVHHLSWATVAAHISPKFTFRVYISVDLQSLTRYIWICFCRICLFQMPTHTSDVAFSSRSRASGVCTPQKVHGTFPWKGLYMNGCIYASYVGTLPVTNVRPCVSVLDVYFHYVPSVRTPHITAQRCRGITILPCSAS